MKDIVRIDERTGEPIHLPPEIANNPNYDKWVSHHEFLAQRAYFTGASVNSEDLDDLMDILKEGWKKLDEK